MMTTSGSSSSLSRSTRLSRSSEFPDENGDRKVKELEKSKVNDDSSDQRQPLGQQLQLPKNAQADSHLTNESCHRTSTGTEDTSLIDSTHAHDEDGFGARQPLRQQQNLQNTHRTLALTYERTSDTTNYRSPLDHRGQTLQINIGDQQPPVQGQTSQINIGDQQPPVQGQTSQINIGDQQPPVQGQTSQINIGDQQPPVQGQTSHNAIRDLCSIYDRTSNEDYDLPYRYMLVVIGAVIFLFGLLYLFRVIG